jgi:hypothetical protein
MCGAPSSLRYWRGIVLLCSIDSAGGIHNGFQRCFRCGACVLAEYLIFDIGDFHLMARAHSDTRRKSVSSVV